VRVIGGRRAITYPSSDDAKVLLSEERAGCCYPPVGGYPPEGGGCRLCGPRRTPRLRRAERPLRQQAVVSSATAATAAMPAFLVSFVLLSRSYIRFQAAPVVQRTLTREAVLDLLIYLSSCENGFGSRKSGVFSRTRFQTEAQPRCIWTHTPIISRADTSTCN